MITTSVVFNSNETLLLHISLFLYLLSVFDVVVLVHRGRVLLYSKVIKEVDILGMVFYTKSEEKSMTEETKEARTTKKERADENVIYVGQKPPMSYVLAVVTQFQGSGSEEVIIKARGRSISTAVDTAEIVRNRFITDAKIKEIKISTESITNEEGRTSNVSSIEITLTKNKKEKKL